MEDQLRRAVAGHPPDPAVLDLGNDPSVQPMSPFSDRSDATTSHTNPSCCSTHPTIEDNRHTPDSDEQSLKGEPYSTV